MKMNIHVSHTGEIIHLPLFYYRHTFPALTANNSALFKQFFYFIKKISCSPCCVEEMKIVLSKIMFMKMPWFLY